jgi:hypothetical protein
MLKTRQNLETDAMLDVECWMLSSLASHPEI